MDISIKTKILIVDDETDACYLLENMLNNKEIQSSCVNSLADAERALKKETPAIIFLDNHLPDGTGVDFIDNIKKHSPNTKIVIITAHDTVADRNRAFMKGADFFIGKPFTKDLIYKTIQELIHTN